MAKNVSINNFANEVVNMMKSYTKDVEEGLNVEVEKLGQEGAEALQKVIQPSASESGSANPSDRRLWKRYAKSWVSEYKEGSNYSQSVIRNKKYYPLTHLLEYGHATRDGKRTRAFAHVKPIEEKLKKQLEENAKKVIEKGGKL